jgi:hypothetical protein
MAKVWVLDTATKGTGAEMVPLDKVLKKPARAANVPPVSARRGRRQSKKSEPRQPRRFKVVDAVTQQVLAQGADARATIDVLKDLGSVMDARIYVWQPEAEKWRLLTLREQRAMWERRHGPHDHTV